LPSSSLQWLLYADLLLTSCAEGVPMRDPIQTVGSGRLQVAQLEACPVLSVITCGTAARSLEIAMTDAPVKTPWHIWLVGLIAVLFNFIGVFDFVMSMAQGAKYQASAGMTPDQIAHYQQMPSWMMVVWAVGVFGAFLASILLLLRRKWALPIFVLSLVAFLVSLLYTYVLTDGGLVMGEQMAITSAVIAGLLAFFSWYCRFMILRGVLR
jgi:hypothetical protein